MLFLALVVGTLNTQVLTTSIPKITLGPSKSPTPSVEITAPAATTSTPESSDIDNLRKAVQEKVQEKIKQIVDATVKERKAYLGIVRSVSPLEISIETRQAEKIMLSITTDTVIVDGTRAKIDVAQVKEGMEVLAMGYTKSATELDVKRLIATTPTKEVPKDIIFTGLLTDVSKTTKTIVATALQNKSLEYVITIDTSTRIFDTEGKDINFASLSKGTRGVFILKPKDAKQKTYTAKRLVLIMPPSPSPTLSQ